MKKYDKGDGMETKRDINKNIVDYNTQEHIVRLKRKLKSILLSDNHQNVPLRFRPIYVYLPKKDGIRGFVGGGSPVKLRKREKMNNNNKHKVESGLAVNIMIWIMTWRCKRIISSQCVSHKGNWFDFSYG